MKTIPEKKKKKQIKQVSLDFSGILWIVGICEKNTFEKKHGKRNPAEERIYWIHKN